jgi:hypothetical protein
LFVRSTCFEFLTPSVEKKRKWVALERRGERMKSRFCIDVSAYIVGLYIACIYMWCEGVSCLLMYNPWDLSLQGIGEFVMYFIVKFLSQNLIKNRVKISSKGYNKFVALLQRTLPQVLTHRLPQIYHEVYCTHWRSFYHEFTGHLTLNLLDILLRICCTFDRSFTTCLMLDLLQSWCECYCLFAVMFSASLTTNDTTLLHV